MSINIIVTPGDKFGMLTVIEEVERSAHFRRNFKCLCDCGNYTIGRLMLMRSGKKTSCGCFHRSDLSKRRLKHGMRDTRIYKVWASMVQRCTNPKTQHYDCYGGRGIKISTEWKEFIAFYNWSIANGYCEGLSIERNDVNGNYEPDNCSWIPMKDQHLNLRNSLYLMHNGVKIHIIDLAKVLGKTYSQIHYKYRKGELLRAS